MPELKPSAGLVPICITVFAQIEHCAEASIFTNKTQTKKNNIIRSSFIRMHQRYNQNHQLKSGIFKNDSFFNYFSANFTRLRAILFI